MGSFGSIWVIHASDDWMHSSVPSVQLLQNHYPILILSPNKKDFLVEFKKEKPKSWVGLNQISPSAVQAIVVSEDSFFYKHAGYDPQQITEAMKLNLKKKRYARGASTITQQVVRNVFLNQNKNLWRKIKELLLAVELEKKLKKEKILEIYLNITEFGDNLFGIEAASLFYFKKNADQLSLKEGAFLAMLLPNPKKYSQSFREKKLSPYAQSIIESILKKIKQTNALSHEDLEIELGQKLDFEHVQDPLEIEER